MSFLLNSNLKAQVGSNNSEPIKTIDISESAEVEVVPNKISLRIYIKDRTEQKGEAKISIKAQEDSLRILLKYMKIDASKLSVVSMSTSYVQVRKREKDAVTVKVFDLQLSKLSDQLEVFKKLDKWQVFNAYVTQYEYTAYDSLKMELQKQALVKAKNRANFLLSSIGETVRNPLEIRFENFGDEGIVDSLLGVSYNNRMMSKIALDQDGEDDSQELEYKKIKIKVSVFVKFQIK